MARYIDADKLLEKAEEIEWFNESTGFYDHINIVHKYDVETAPTADVVPKSEVFLASSDAMKMLIETHGYAVTHDEDVKREVAREIFEELARKSTYVFPTMLYTIAKRDVDELKNKYIGGNDNG